MVKTKKVWTSLPNFATMGESELREFGRAFRRPTRRAAEALLGGKRAGYTRIALKLAGWAEKKAIAMRYRREGDIGTARIYEACCDMTYTTLPKDIRW